MPPKARVGSLEAIETFRSDLVVYMAQARSALEEISGEVVHTRVWLEDDQRAHWEREMRRRSRVLEEAQAALFSAKISKFSDGVSLEQLAVQKARRAVQECEIKMRTLKKWGRDFEGTVQPLLKQVEKLHTILSNDLVKALAELAHIISTLSAYAQGGAAPAAAGSEAAPSGAGEQAAGTTDTHP